MKIKTLLITLIAVILAACSNTNPSKENVDALATNERNTNSLEIDTLGTIITADGVGSLKLGATIPDTIPGCEVIFIIYEMEDGSENVVVNIKKDDNLILQLRPESEDETDASKDFIAGILVISDQFATTDSIHVGSSIHDILKKQEVTTLFNGKRVFVKDNGLTYILKPEDYEGELPAGTFDNPVEVEQPTFKADAKIRAIGVFGE